MAERTYFSIKAGEQTSELFSVQRRPNGDLLIYMKRAAENSAIPGRKIIENRLSVHVSPNAKGHTIIRHDRIDGGIYARYYSFVKSETNTMIWPAYGCLSANLCDNRYVLPIKAYKEKIVSLGEYDPRCSVLEFFLLITVGHDQVSRSFGLNIKATKFGYFTIHVMWGYIWVPSIHKGSENWPATATRFDFGSNKSEQRQSNGARSFRYNRLARWYAGTMAHFRKHYLEDIQQVYGPQRVPHEIVVLSKTIHRRPLAIELPT